MLSIGPTSNGKLPGKKVSLKVGNFLIGLTFHPLILLQSIDTYTNFKTPKIPYDTLSVITRSITHKASKQI